MVLACGLCAVVYTLLFYVCRVKLKHFEKFQDTTEALAGELTLLLQKKSNLCHALVHSLLACVHVLFLFLAFKLQVFKSELDLMVMRSPIQSIVQ